MTRKQWLSQGVEVVIGGRCCNAIEIRGILLDHKPGEI
jgi:hypothetical protein